MSPLPQSAKQSGVSMMLKALGVDPGMFEQVADAVKEVAASLKRIEEAQEKILKRLGELEREKAEASVIHG